MVAQTIAWMDGGMAGWTNGHMDGTADNRTVGQEDVGKDTRTDGRTAGWTDGQMAGKHVHGWTDRTLVG